MQVGRRSADLMECIDGWDGMDLVNDMVMMLGLMWGTRKESGSNNNNPHAKSIYISYANVTCGQ